MMYDVSVIIYFIVPVFKFVPYRMCYLPTDIERITNITLNPSIDIDNIFFRRRGKAKWKNVEKTQHMKYNYLGL